MRLVWHMHELKKKGKFITWLTKMGAEVQEPTSIYEVIRFRTENGTSVIYTGKRGITFTGDSQDAYDKFIDGKNWKAVNRKRQQLRAKKSRIAVRDGKKCFVHQERLRFDELTIEHLLNFSHGGNDNLNNLALVCSPCNSRLGNLPVAKKIELIYKIREEHNAIHTKTISS